MKKLLLSAAIAVLAAAPLLAKDAPKAAPVALKASVAQLTVNGDSSLHKWHSDARSVTVLAEVSKPGDLLAALKAGALTRLELKAGVESLHSPEGSGMDKNTWKTLESKDFPEISFSLASYTVKGDAVEAKGKLTIHGVTQDVVLPGSLAAKDGGVSVKGAYDMKMTDYGIKPPVMMLGAIKVKDELSIAYEFSLLP